MAELKVKSKFFAMEDKVEVEGLDLDTVERFSKVYIDEVPEEVLSKVSSYFNDETKTVRFTREMVTKCVFVNFNEYLLKNSLTSDIIASGVLDGYSSRTLNSNLFSGFRVTNGFVAIGKGNFAGSPIYFALNGTSSGAEQDNRIRLHPETVAYGDIVFGNDYYAGVKEALMKDLVQLFGYQVINGTQQIEELIANRTNALPLGTKLYIHDCAIKDGSNNLIINVAFYSSSPNPVTSVNNVPEKGLIYARAVYDTNSGTTKRLTINEVPFITSGGGAVYMSKILKTVIVFDNTTLEVSSITTTNTLPENITDTVTER